MAGLLSGLADLGLDNLESADIFAAPKEPEEEKENHAPAKPTVQEKDLVYEHSYVCPVCSSKITSKTMRTGKTRILRTDRDLRPVFDGINVQKYEVVACKTCGFSALNRYFVPMPSVQSRLVKEKISQNVKMRAYDGEIYTNEEALERYKLALACAVVRQAKFSEKAYTCLKAAWMLRGWQEELTESGENGEKLEKLKEDEREFLQNALDGFISAKMTESYPMGGMDEPTVDYLIAVLAFEFGRYDVASKSVAAILVAPGANSRLKDKARELKDEILVHIKKQ